MKNFICFSFLFASLSAFSQFYDDFSRGYDLSNEWMGDREKFRINADSQLQLDAPRDGSPACLYIQSSRVRNTTWACWVKMDFNPSSSNYVKIYLFSSMPDLSGELEGLYVRLGHTNRNVSLHSQSKNTSRTLIAGETNRLNRSAVVVRIKTIMTNSGAISLYSKLDDDFDYVLEGTYQMTQSYTGGYFGISCVYSVTRSQLFYFDDFEIKILEEGGDGGENSTEDVTIAYDVGIENFLIRYNFPTTGNRCRILIFDYAGRTIAQVANNERLGTEGIFYWNGTSESGGHVRTGVYILYMEVLNDRGMEKKFKIPFVVRR